MRLISSPHSFSLLTCFQSSFRSGASNLKSYISQPFWECVPRLENFLRCMRLRKILFGLRALWLFGFLHLEALPLHLKSFCLHSPPSPPCALTVFAWTTSFYQECTPLLHAPLLLGKAA